MLIDRIRIRQLRTFVAIAEHGSLIKAANAMAVTQPAVTKALAQLEDLVGKPLADRSRRGIRLTLAGQNLLRYAGQCLRMLEEGLEGVAQADAIDPPTISIGALPGVAATLLPAAIARFEKLGIIARIRVRVGRNIYLLSLLRQGEVDCVIGRLGEPAAMRGLSFESLYTEQIIFSARPSHFLSSKKKVTLRALSRYPMLVPDHGTRIRDTVDQFFISAGISLPERRVESIDPMFARAYVMQTDAIWCAPIGGMENDLRTRTLCRLAINTEMTAGDVGLTLKSDRPPSEVLQQLFNEVRAVAHND